MLKVDCKSQLGIGPEACEEMQGGEKDTGWRKRIPQALDRMQSRVLVGIVVPLLVWGAVSVSNQRSTSRSLLFPLLFSCGFAALVWMLRSATLPAAGIGLLICLTLSQTSVIETSFSPVLAYRPAIVSLIVLFVLTFVATRLGRARKERRGLAEARTGRRASQIVANLGVATLCAAAGWYPGCIAALAEAAADTVSSEIGQAFGGRAWLITTLRRVPAGRDGGMSLLGSAAGVFAAALVVAVGAMHHALGSASEVVFAAACLGLLFDSVLGATIEERGWVGNDLVNFSSTLFAAGLPYLWLLVWGRLSSSF
jgi:uncharacterized protein (TIGR00297 family)